MNHRSALEINLHGDPLSHTEQEQYPFAPDEPRLLILSGSWNMPKNHYELTATIYLTNDGGADGSIHWIARTIWGKNVAYTGVERVRGQYFANSLALNGQMVDPGLAKDNYRIILNGTGSSGNFLGTSRTCLNDWSGRLRGSYIFVNKLQQ